MRSEKGKVAQEKIWNEMHDILAKINPETAAIVDKKWYGPWNFYAADQNLRCSQIETQLIGLYPAGIY